MFFTSVTEIERVARPDEGFAAISGSVAVIVACDGVT